MWETYRNYTRMVVSASVKLCEVDNLRTQVLLHVLLRDQILLHKHQKSCLRSLPHLENNVYETLSNSNESIS